MVSTVLLLGFLFSALVCFLVPLGGLLYLQIRKHKIATSFFLGAATFFVAQIVLRIPIMQYILPNQSWYIRLSYHTVGFSIFTGFTAGLFEEVGRYLTMKLFLKKKRQVDGIAFGLGHGGVEAILIVGVSLLISLFYLIVLRFQSEEALSNLIGATATTQFVSAIEGLSSYTSFLSGIERISAFGLHIACSLLVLYGVNQQKSLRYLFTAILLHTIVDSTVGIFPMLGIDTLGLEVFVFIYSAVILFIALRLWNKTNTMTDTSS